MTRSLAIALCCLPWLWSLAEDAKPSDIRRYLDEAAQHLARRDVAQYEQALQRVWQSEGDVNDRVEAGVMLARAHCRIHHNPVEARKVLAAAWTLGAKPALPLIELAALETFEGDYPAACDAARAALPLSTTTRERREALTRFGQAVCHEIFQETIRSVHADTTLETDARVREAVELLQPFIQDEPGWPEPARCQVLLGLLAGDGPAALRAWQSYFLLLPKNPPLKPPGEPPRDFGDLVLVGDQWTHRPLPFTEPGEVLARLLPTFTTGADDATRTTVVRALAGSRFFPEAAALALRWDVPQDQAIGEIILYGRWTDRLSRLLGEEHRQHALGKGYRTHLRIPYVLDVPFGRTNLEKIIAAESKRLWEQWRPDTAFREDRFGLGVALGFGAVMRHIEAPSVFNYGHSVLEFDKTVEQYGRKRVMKWVILDGQVCRGYGAWLWKAAANRSGRGVGGWANPPAEFVHTRNQESLYVWETWTDPELNRRLKDRVKYWTAEDDKNAKSDPCGYLRGLSLRLMVRANEGLLERLRDEGYKGAELRTLFLKERERLVNESNVVAHEGRHALDLSENPTGHTNAELEFRAKCSQVVFAPDALLAVGVGNIFSPNINPEGDGHGLANARIMKRLVAWMEVHAREIAELDASRPLLPQFDRLTEEQMREAFRSMDPWASSDGRTD
jgi:hypothetical protein